jgi:hypothetical protein
MRSYSKLILVACAATAVMALVVGTAGARRIAATLQGYRAIWSSLNFNAAGNLIQCPVTLEGSFHSRTISKVCGQLIGYITKAFVREASCTGGSGRALTETLPWHVQYLGFIGTLPTITGIRLILVGARFQVRNEAGTTCLAGTTQRSPGGGIVNVEAAGAARTLRADETLNIPLGGEFVCLFSGGSNFEGTAEVFAQGSTTTRIRVSLVQ